MDKGMHLAIDRRDPLQTGGCIFLGASQTARDSVRGFHRRQFRHVDLGHVSGFLMKKARRSNHDRRALGNG
jgi:hypothetical protein